MQFWKQRKIVIALIVLAAALPVQSGATERHDRDVVVEAPTTDVIVSDRKVSDRKERVLVEAPATEIDVDTERRRVRIRVPFFDGDIRW
ncbi:MAG: hypothetical protein KKB37_02775 [Alphaproteobacteria bacterium]|nr:hypothetical protein [Alphaproteobacteria bacterium]